MILDQDILTDALDHIARLAGGSRTSTKRLRWIEARARAALQNQVLESKAIEMPQLYGDTSLLNLRRRRAEAIDRADTLASALDALVEMVVCHDPLMMDHATRQVAKQALRTAQEELLSYKDWKEKVPAVPD